MSSCAAKRVRMTWFAVVASLSALAGCSILDGPTEAPTSASIAVGGPGPGPLTLVTSTRFVQVFDNFGNRRDELVIADTSTVNPGYEADIALGFDSRIYVSIGRPLDSASTPQVSLQLFVRDEVICEVESILTDANPEMACSYTFN